MINNYKYYSKKEVDKLSTMGGGIVLKYQVNPWNLRE